MKIPNDSRDIFHHAKSAAEDLDRIQRWIHDVDYRIRVSKAADVCSKKHKKQLKSYTNYRNEKMRELKKEVDRLSKLYSS